MTKVSLHRVLVGARGSASPQPITLVPNLHSARVPCGPLSVQLSLWNCLYLRELAPASCCGRVSPVTGQTACGLSPYSLHPRDGSDLSKLSQRARLLRETSELEGAQDLAERLTAK